jgi:hypothetical protein
MSFINISLAFISYYLSKYSFKNHPCGRVFEVTRQMIAVYRSSLSEPMALGMKFVGLVIPPCDLKISSK